MLSRTVLPILRQRSLPTNTRVSVLSPRIRSYAKARRSNDYSIPASASRPEWQKQEQELPKSPSTPLRPVKVSANERIHPQSTERSSTLGNPVAGPGVTETLRTGYKSPHEIHSAPPNVDSPPGQIPPPASSRTHVSENEPEVEQQPMQPLPDLTKGIPSTLAAELGQASKRNAATEDKMNITEDPESPPPGPGGRGGGELPRSAYVSSSDRRRTTAIRIVYLGLVAGATTYMLYLARNWDTEEEAQQHAHAPNGYTPGAMYNRIRARFGSTVSYYSDPVSAKLLPDEEADPNMRMPFVLVLSMDDFLVHSEWSRQNGYRIAKRPGVDYFVRYLSQYYELVLFTSQPSYIAEQVWKKLDPYGIIRFPLFREHTLYKDGGYVKDLSYLNRDLKKVIIMDTDAHHVINQPENAIVVPKWNGDPNDQTLIQFIPFLEYLATMGFDDARSVLKSFEGKYIPAEFARREKLLREKFDKEQEGKRKTRSGKGLGLGSLFGAAQQPQGVLSASGTSAEGKMIWDQIREQGQKNYEAFERKIREEGPSWLAEQEAADRKAQEDFKQSMTTGMFGWFGPKPTETGERK